MEGILRGGSIPEMIPFATDLPVLLYPVRHHSPVCSYHLCKTIALYQPDIILIEGPENANDLIPILTDSRTKLPVAIYYFYKDKAKLISAEGSDYHCYYPFLYASPEYNAMLQAKQLGIPAQFIDLPYSEILIHTEQAKGLRTEQERHSYASDAYLAKSRFFARICEKTGLRNFEEFWEKQFEIGGIQRDTATFVRQMYTYCMLTRQGTPQAELEADGCLAREQHMAYRIQTAMQTYRKVLVVTGGFHSYGLYQQLQGGTVKPFRLHTFASDVQDCYPIAYSYEAADALSGYASGMQHPQFYDRVYRDLCDGVNPSTVYRTQTLDLLVKTAKAAAKQDLPISTADVMAAYLMMQGLAALRGAVDCGMYELYDGVLAAMVKGEKTKASSIPLELLGKLATGDAIGFIGDRTHTPPLIADFEQQCERLRLKARSVVPQKAELSLFQKESGMAASRLFHQMAYLGTGFAKRLKGPDLHQNKDRSRIREIWEYRRTPQVDAALIDHTTHGVTIAEACRTMASQTLRRERRCEVAAQTAVDCFLMGIAFTPQDIAVMEEILVQDGDFFSIGTGLRYFDMLESLQTLYDFADASVMRYIEQCFGKLIALLPTMAALSEEQAGDCIAICRLLYGVTGRLLPDRQVELVQALQTLTEREQKEPSLYGAAMGLLYAMDNAYRPKVEAAMQGFLRGSLAVQKRGARFLQGLFITASDLALQDEAFLTMTNTLMVGMEYADFLEILPFLRLAFSRFTPYEIQRIAEAVAKLHATTDHDILHTAAIDEGLYAYGETLDRMIYAQLNEEGNA